MHLKRWLTSLVALPLLLLLLFKGGSTLFLLLILLASWVSLWEYFQITLGEWQTGLDLDDMQPLDDVAAISPRPILILAGGRDAIIGPDAGQRYYAAAGEPKALWFEPDLEHVSFWRIYPDEYARRVVGFFDETLKEESTP